MNKGAAKIFEDNLKGENVQFEEFECGLNWTRCKGTFTWIFEDHPFL